MNKDRQSREKCKYCPNVIRKNGYYICRFRPEMRLDRYTRRPDWCKKKMVVIGPVKDLKLNDKKIADEGFADALSVIDELIREDAEAVQQILDAERKKKKEDTANECGRLAKEE